VVVSGDRDRLAQAVDNLIGNALRHGVPPVEVHARAVGEDIEIAVQDAGPGVSDEMRPRLFERFATGHGLGGTGRRPARRLRHHAPADRDACAGDERVLTGEPVRATPARTP
jgi:hypothetical protein